MLKKLLLFSLLSWSTTTFASATSQSVDEDLVLLAGYLQGNYTNVEQVSQGNTIPTQKLDITRVWNDRDDAYWFYVEKTTTKDYRIIEITQCVYKVTKTDDNSLQCTPCSLPASLLTSVPAPLNLHVFDSYTTLSPEQLFEQKSCSMIFTKSTDAMTFIGRTSGKECAGLTGNSQKYSEEYTLRSGALEYVLRGSSQKADTYIFKKIAD